MIIFFLFVLVIVVHFIQQWTLENGFESLEGDYWPEENVIDPGEHFDMTIELKNNSSFPLFFLKVQHNGLDEQLSSLSTWLKARQKTKVRFSILAVKRGRYLLDRPRIYCGDFLGLKTVKKELEQYREVVVAPAPYNTQDLKQVLGKFLGDYSVRRFIHEDPILTLGFREYTGREPMKMISWKQSAQKQRLMVKEFDHTVEPVISVLVNVDSSASSDHAMMEKCYSLARSVCTALEAKGVSYDFHTNAVLTGGFGDSYSVNEGIGSRHFIRVMEYLGRSTYASAFSLDKLLEMSEELGGKERGKIIISPGAISLSSSDQVLVLNATLL